VRSEVDLFGDICHASLLHLTKAASSCLNSFSGHMITGSEKVLNISFIKHLNLLERSLLLHCVAACCSEMQYVTVCRSVSQCVAVCSIVVHPSLHERNLLLQCDAVCIRVSQCVLQYVAASHIRVFLRRRPDAKNGGFVWRVRE